MKWKEKLRKFFKMAPGYNFKVMSGKVIGLRFGLEVLMTDSYKKGK